MYTSLDRIDLVTKAKEGGRQRYIQTDHRSAAEIEAEPELSVLFALTRVIAASATGAREGGADVLYVCAAEPPPFLHEAVCSAGAQLHVDSDPAPAYPSPRELEDLADAAFGGLAARVSRRDGHALDEALLRHLEDTTLEDPPDREEDEGAYWTRLHELAAVCGELLRTRTGGRWKAPSDQASLLPFVFSVGDASFSVADKAQRFLDHGDSQRPSQLLSLAQDLGSDEGPLMVNLKPADYPRDKGVCRELMSGGGPVGMPLPLVFLGHDQPHSFAYLPEDSTDVEASFEEALANLARLDIPAEEHDVGGVKILAVSDHFYASEKILDPSFLKSLHSRLGAELLAAAIPAKGLLLLSSEVAPPAISGFVALAQMQYDNAPHGQGLTPAVFFVGEGQLVGHLDTKADSPEPAPKKKGFWSRLTGGD